MGIRLISILLLIVLPYSGKAQAENDHLIPADCIFSLFDHQFEYYPKVRKVLFKNLSHAPEIRFLRMPSFSPENILDIHQDNDKYFLIYRIAENMIYNKRNWKNIHVTEYKKEIDIRSVSLIRDLFLEAVSKTRYYQQKEDEMLGLDGETYYLSAWQNGFGLKTGIVWSPQTPNMKKLIGISYKLIDFAKSESALVSFDENFTNEIEQLKKELKKDNIITQSID